MRWPFPLSSVNMGMSHLQLNSQCVSDWKSCFLWAHSESTRNYFSRFFMQLACSFGLFIHLTFFTEEKFEEISSPPPPHPCWGFGFFCGGGESTNNLCLLPWYRFVGLSHLQFVNLLWSPVTDSDYHSWHNIMHVYTVSNHRGIEEMCLQPYGMVLAFGTEPR